MLTSWILGGLIFSGIVIILGIRSQKRSSSRNLDRAFARARYARSNGLMSSGKLYR